MRIVFSGAGPVTVITAKALIKNGHEVVVIEVDKGVIDELSEELDCSFIHGDAGKPDILSQANPEGCDFLFCLTNSDQANIITALLGRSMGFNRVVPSIEDAGLQQLCDELELEDTIVPVRTMSHHLVNMVRGLENIEPQNKRVLENEILMSNQRPELFSFVSNCHQIDIRVLLFFGILPIVLWYIFKFPFEIYRFWTRHCNPFAITVRSKGIMSPKQSSKNQKT